MKQEKTMGWTVFCGEGGCRRTVSVPFSKITIVELVGDRARVYAKMNSVEACETEACGRADAHSSVTDKLEIAYLLTSILPEVVVIQE